MTERPTFLSDLDAEHVKEILTSMGEPAWRAKTILAWTYQKRAKSFEDMTDLPKALREKLSHAITFSSVTEVKTQESRDGTRKALLEIWDGRSIETALIPSTKGHYTVCVSSQVGCAVGCPFCASGQQGFERNLGASEICDQVLYFNRRIEPEETIGNIVYMGMGEPMTNYAEVLSATKHLNASWGFGKGARSITISTAGYIPGIERLSKEKLQVGLAVSLHAGNNALRDQLVPINRKYPLDKLIPACAAYVQKTGRRVTFEYCLFAGINDSLEQARELGHLVRGLNCHINLITANHTGGCDWQPPAQEKVKEFEDELLRLHIVATRRKSMGRDIQAACGQLKGRPS